MPPSIDTRRLSSKRSVITAGFSPGSYPLSVSVVDGAGGTVARQPSGVSCPGACDASFASGSQVTLTATPKSGYAFEG